MTKYLNVKIRINKVYFNLEVEDYLLSVDECYFDVVKIKIKAIEKYLIKI